MNLLRRLFARAELPPDPYGAEVLCSNWVTHPLESSPKLLGPTAEELREADAPTFLARIYASQGC